LTRCVDCGHALSAGSRSTRCGPCAAARRKTIRLADYHRHRARRAETRRRWEQAHADACRARFKRFYWRHPELRRAQSRAYATANGQVLRERSRRYRSRRKAQRTGRYSDLAVFERDRWICGICQTLVDPTLGRHHRLGPTIDHIVPISAGGVDGPDNVQLAHRSCNSSKGPRPWRLAPHGLRRHLEEGSRDA
jgi:5-methylcytosine-specific restriction endonuclease McrA